MGYSFWLAARVLLYALSHRQDSTYHGLCYTSRGALAGTRNSSVGPPWRIDPTTHRTMSERSYHGATSRFPIGLEQVPSCKPSTYHPIIRWHSHYAIAAGYISFKIWNIWYRSLQVGRLCMFFSRHLPCIKQLHYYYNISRSNQCSTTGVTKAVVCVILSVGWCI